MKCPKCGSDLDTGFNCPKCGRENWQTIYEVKPELLTAEKLLWLAENRILAEVNYSKPTRQFIEIKVNDWKYFNGIGIVPTYCRYGRTIEEAINAAYEWAKEQK